MFPPAGDVPQSVSDLALPSFGGYATPASSLLGVSFWPRVAARSIDLIVHYVVASVTGRMFGIMLRVASGGHVAPIILWRLRHIGLTGFACSLVGATAYGVIFTAVYGGSIGKRLLSMVVVQEDGTPCSTKSALIRELAYYIDSLFFGLIAYTAMQNSEQEQRHGDEWAHTIVCKRSAVAQENLQGPGWFVVALVFALAADSALLMTGWLWAIAH
jgi:uncharacterized RDD family membrane protein YckC